MLSHFFMLGNSRAGIAFVFLKETTFHAAHKDSKYGNQE